jgi:predicted amidohydrolase YtcJ
MNRIALWGVTCCVVALAGCAHRQPADLVLLNGKIVTLDPARPQVSALAARGQTLVALGDERQVRPLIGKATRVLDLRGRLALPGFIEAHGHFLGLGELRLGLDLSGARSWKEVVALVAARARAARPGAWVVGRGWHQEKWRAPPRPAVDGLPLHAELSRAAPENPVLLTHASGHSAMVNARALALAGITGETPDPEGGQILRDAGGHPTGLLRETAMAPVRAALARHLRQRTVAQVEARRRRAAALATRECLHKGVTSFQDAGATLEEVDLFRKLADEGKLGIRLWVMLIDDNRRLRANLARYRVVGHGGQRLTVRAIKRLIDGALGSHGAWLLAPYSDLPQSTGLNTTPVASIRETAALALEHDYQLCVHAIGDRGVREVLDIYQDALSQRPGGRDRRWRVEHAQHIHPDDIPRFARLGVMASVQGVHCTSDGPWVVKRLGVRRAREGAYPWRSLLRAGARLANGTDTPVEDVDPIAGFYALVTRRMADGRAFFPEQRLTRQQALHAMTLGAAYAAFEEHAKGSLQPGKLADVVVLSRDILTVPEDQIPGTRVEMTILGGEVVFQLKAK